MDADKRKQKDSKKGDNMKRDSKKKDSKIKDNTVNPAHAKPLYPYEDHIRFAKEKIESTVLLSDEQKRRFNTGAVKIINEIYGEHTELSVDISKPPPIAVDLSRTAQNATRDMPSTSTSQRHSSTIMTRTPRALYDLYRMRSIADDIMIAKKSYHSYHRSRKTSRKHHLKKHSKRLHSTTSSQCLPATTPTNICETIIIDSDED